MPFSDLDRLLQQRSLELARQSQYDLPFGGTTDTEYNALARSVDNARAPVLTALLQGFQGANLATQQARQVEYDRLQGIRKLDADITAADAANQLTIARAQGQEIQNKYAGQDAQAQINYRNAQTAGQELQNRYYPETVAAETAGRLGQAANYYASADQTRQETQYMQDTGYRYGTPPRADATVGGYSNLSVPGAAPVQTTSAQPAGTPNNLTTPVAPTVPTTPAAPTQVSTAAVSPIAPYEGTHSAATAAKGTPSAVTFTPNGVRFDSAGVPTPDRIPLGSLNQNMLNILELGQKQVLTPEQTAHFLFLQREVENYFTQNPSGLLNEVPYFKANPAQNAAYQQYTTLGIRYYDSLKPKQEAIDSTWMAP